MMNKFNKTSTFKKYFFVPFLFIILALSTISCSLTPVEEEIGNNEIKEGSKTYLIDKGDVQSPADRP